MSTGTESGRTRVVDELAVVFGPAGRGFVRRLAEIILGVAVTVTVLAVLVLVGAVVDDRAISANPAVAEAEVLDGSNWTRTLVRFTVANGEAVVPELGVFYPLGLQVGESVPVEYDVTNPSLVRVAGRGALSQSWVLGLDVLGMWVVLGPLAVWLRRRRRADVAGRPPS